MKRLHVHISVKDLSASIRFYRELFDAEPVFRKDDYAKWMLDDPRVNFAISQRSMGTGVQHLGIQAEDRAELEDVYSRLKRADRPCSRKAQRLVAMRKAKRVGLKIRRASSGKPFLHRARARSTATIRSGFRRYALLKPQ